MLDELASFLSGESNSFNASASNSVIENATNQRLAAALGSCGQHEDDFLRLKVKMRTSLVSHKRRRSAGADRGTLERPEQRTLGSLVKAPIHSSEAVPKETHVRASLPGNDSSRCRSSSESLLTMPQTSLQISPEDSITSETTGEQTTAGGRASTTPRISISSNSSVADGVTQEKTLNDLTSAVRSKSSSTASVDVSCDNALSSGDTATGVSDFFVDEPNLIPDPKQSEAADDVMLATSSNRRDRRNHRRLLIARAALAAAVSAAAERVNEIIHSPHCGANGHLPYHDPVTSSAQDPEWALEKLQPQIENTVVLSAQAMERQTVATSASSVCESTAQASKRTKRKKRKRSLVVLASEGEHVVDAPDIVLHHVPAVSSDNEVPSPAAVALKKRSKHWKQTLELILPTVSPLSATVASVSSVSAAATVTCEGSTLSLRRKRSRSHARVVLPAARSVETPISPTFTSPSTSSRFSSVPRPSHPNRNASFNPTLIKSTPAQTSADNNSSKKHRLFLPAGVFRAMLQAKPRLRD